MPILTPMSPSTACTFLTCRAAPRSTLSLRSFPKTGSSPLQVRRHFIQTYNLNRSHTLQQSPSPIPTRVPISNQTKYITIRTMSSDPYKEKNKDEPGLNDKIQDLTSFISASKFGMMTTRTSDGLLVSRCMALAASENGGVDLIFHTNTESGKTDDIEKDGHINMAFLNGSGEWASVSGVASIITSRDVVKKYYSPSLKAWLGDLGDGKHDGSENDPRIGVIRIEAKTATYAVNRSNFVVRATEMVSGAVTGNAAQVNKLREISEQEFSQWRSSQ